MASGIRWTTEEYIEQCRIVHGDKYDYSLVEYINNKTKVKIICREHGPFEQLGQHHMRGRGCTLCGNEYNSKRQRLSTQEFIQKAQRVHGDRYDYSLVDYIISTEKVIVICRLHGLFPQTPVDHLSGCGCTQCYLEKSSRSKTKDTSQFIEQAEKIHKGKYDYSLVEYKKAHEPVLIICPIHGIFEQKPAFHLQGQGCRGCAGTMKLTQEEFIERAIKMHGDKYDYSKVNYINSATKVEILCLRHNSFFQAPQDHLSGHGCQLCYSSTGEERISGILTQWGVKFTREKKFDRCKDKRLLPFDFHIQIGKLQILLEFDGDQHHFSVKHFGGDEALERNQRHDAIKTAFAKEYGFILIRISFSEFDNIETILRAEIEKHTGQPIEAIAHKKQDRTKIAPVDPASYKQGPLL